MVSMEELLKGLEKAKDSMNGMNYGVAYTEITRLSEELKRNGVTFGVLISTDALTELNRFRENKELGIQE